jgi:hypothetical protein
VDALVARLAPALLGALLLGPRPSADPTANQPLPPLPADPAKARDAVSAGSVGDDKQRGVALGLFAEDVSFSYGPLLAEIVALGATHVALIVPLYQTDGASDDIHLHTRLSPNLETIANTIRAARRAGLEVTLFPIVRLTAPAPGQWRGTLAPRDPDRWFRRYGDLMGDLAAVANLTGAGRLVIGSELSTLDVDIGRWRPLCDRVRGIFKGKLVYSANWDHYREAKLMDLVDEEGITGYFNLRADAHAPGDEAALEAAWRRVKADLAAWRAARPPVPFVFTELGYRSRAGSTAAPWDESTGGAVDLDEQRRGFAAFRRAWAATPFLGGVYIWNWYGHGGPSSGSYTPRNKPAEPEVKALLKDL